MEHEGSTRVQNSLNLNQVYVVAQMSLICGLCEGFIQKGETITIGERNRTEFVKCCMTCSGGSK